MQHSLLTPTAVNFMAWEDEGVLHVLVPRMNLVSEFIHWQQPLLMHGVVCPLALDFRQSKLSRSIKILLVLNLRIAWSF